jgi:hypothetical protein
VLYQRAVDRTVENESGGDSVEAHVDRAAAAARSKMVVTVECLLLPVKWVNKETPPVFTLATIGLFVIRLRGWSMLYFFDFPLNLFSRL